MLEAPLYAVQAIPPVPATQQPLQLLGGLSPETFMRKHWQKKPLLVRGAFPQFAQACPIPRDDLFALADSQDVESRMVEKTAKSWKLHHGPFATDSLPPLKRKAWTLLVQGVNLHHPAAEAVMQEFRFIPDARLDDLMISYATDTGGVGPHYDAYDVFLIQAHGKRRWRIGAKYDEALQPGMPLKILQNFVPEEEYVLEPGDMLYLPPHYAHDGIAEGECMTWSVGFRVPQFGEMCADFMHWLADDLEEAIEADEMPAMKKHYADPKQPPVEQPAALPSLLLEALTKRLQSIQWDDLSVKRFLGANLTEPKPHVFFTPPARALSDKAFTTMACKDGLRLSARTLALYVDNLFFINGEEFACTGVERNTLQNLANQRFLSAEQCTKALEKQTLLETFKDWYEAGWVV